MLHSRPLPKYRKHKPSGQAVVTVGGRDHYLGPHGTKASHAEYDRLIAEWLANGRRLSHDEDGGLTVNELIVAYWTHAERYYVKNGQPTSELNCLKQALGPVRRLYGRKPACRFGPRALKACRQKMIDAGWARTSINIHVSRIRKMFKWAAENELLPAEVWHGLQTVSGLRCGRSEAKETEPVQPVPDAFVEAIRPFVTRYIWAMVQLQTLTGMRSGEVTIMRACDLDTGGDVWIYVPGSHKTEHHERGREIYLGPRAQSIVQDFFEPDLRAYLFSPRDAENERLAELRAKRKTDVQPSQRNRKRRKPKRQPGERYSPASYRRAIQRGIEKANQKRDEEGLPPIPMWTAHQLRHNRATEARKHGGIELAQVILGHSKADVTQVYAERDRERAIRFMVKYG